MSGLASRGDSARGIYLGERSIYSGFMAKRGLMYREDVVDMSDSSLRGRGNVEGLEKRRYGACGFGEGDCRL